MSIASRQSLTLVSQREAIKELALDIYKIPEHCAGINDADRAKMAIEAAIVFYEEFDTAFPPPELRTRLSDVHVGGEINIELQGRTGPPL